MVDNHIEYNKLYVHNVGKRDNDIRLIIKVDKKTLAVKEDIILEFDNKVYNLKELDYGCDNKYNYYDLMNIKFNEYETKNFNFKLNNNEVINYEFITV